MAGFVAIDLGAESGRAMLGRIDERGLRLQEIARFANVPARLPAGLYWNSIGILTRIIDALRICSTECAIVPDGIAVDSWGVDFGLLASDGSLVESPRHYRDPRTEGMLEATFARVPRRAIYERTGIQFLRLNTLYQLHAMTRAGAPSLAVAHKLLFMSDLFTYWLTGEMRCEITLASTSQFYDPRARRWATDLLQAIGAPPSLPANLVEPGTRMGALLPHIAESCKLPANVPVYATASHDTASAVVAAPAAGDDWCYISSGTWSLMGVEVPEPIINDQALELGFTNEVGFGGRIRLLKNIPGLWLIQECRKDWALAGRDYSYQQLAEMAAECAETDISIEPRAFDRPGHMPQQIAEYCARTGQRVPQSPGEVCCVILQSLARTYAGVLGDLEALLGRRIGLIHIVGGGSRNALLNQMTANATGRTVVAGPAEATAAGNILVQAIAAGVIGSLGEARALVRRSFPLTTFTPGGQHFV